MTTLEVEMKKHHINVDLSSESTSHGQALYAFVFSYNASSYSTSIDWLIDSGAFYHMSKDQTIFSTMHECNTKQIFIGDNISLCVVGSGAVPLDNGHFSDVLCVPRISCKLLSVYQITHSSEGKPVMFTPHQVVINDFKDIMHVMANGIVDNITKLYKFNNFGSSPFPSVFFLIMMTWENFRMSDLDT